MQHQLALWDRLRQWCPWALWDPLGLRLWMQRLWALLDRQRQ
jgi:hypothetical protein